MKFQVKLTAHGVGAFIVVPRDVAAKLGFKGRPKVKAVIAGAPYRGSLMPMGDGTFGLGVLRSIQEEKGIDVGDTIAVDLEPDTEERTVTAPPDLASALERDAKAAAAWDRLSYTNRKEIARALEEAKKPETPERRLSAALARLRS
ncbi:MAG TPA: YdeI/OmpD-associated family protein [Candidatus Dormibacteraeota bacterium]|nr:YdeI/OmpD-associated family protein [Candidatus Dormibacteraeota bacterium]